jgi:endonuclease YncB( thermonuclease family)
VRSSAVRAIAKLILLSLALPASAATLTGEIVGITDGDTATILTQENIRDRIRLAGIDAPEHRQPYGRASRYALSDLVYGRIVTVEWHKRDRYGRIVGKILIDGKDAGLAQIEAGLAWHYKAYQNEQEPADRESYAQAEEAARTKRLGLWQDPHAMPPWQWRRGKITQAKGDVE